MYVVYTLNNCRWGAHIYILCCVCIKHTLKESTISTHFFFLSFFFFSFLFYLNFFLFCANECEKCQFFSVDFHIMSKLYWEYCFLLRTQLPTRRRPPELQEESMRLVSLIIFGVSHRRRVIPRKDKKYIYNNQNVTKTNFDESPLQLFKLVSTNLWCLFRFLQFFNSQIQIIIVVYSRENRNK